MMKINKSLLGAMLAVGSVFGAAADNVTFHAPEGFQVMSLSPNGKWACGVYVDASMNTYAFRWNLDGGSIEMLSYEPSLAYGVANDGTISGEFSDPDALPNGVPVIMPGFWRDGAWHHLDMPAGAKAEGIGYGISPDGQYMTGSIVINGRYTAVIWRNGEVYRVLNTGSDSVAFAVSPDGQSATGFNSMPNRTACYWAPDGTVVYFQDSEEYSQGPWNYGRKFSPDGSKLLYWGGWQVDEEQNVYLYSVYDINTGERTMVKAPAYNSDLEFFDISNNGTLVGTESGRGYIWSDGSGQYIDQYLAARGVDLGTFDDFYSGADYYQGQLPIFNVVSISEDEKVMVMRYYNTRGQVSSMVLKIDQDLTKVAPAETTIAQLEGLNTVALKWLRPVGANSIRGYNIYRDGKKINGFMPVNALYYYDRNLTPGTYTYQVSVVNLSGSEVMSDEMIINVTADPIAETPINAFGRQKGVNSAHLLWDAPLSNLVHRRYFDPNSKCLYGFAVYEPVEVEMAIKYDKADIANYAGHKISEVSFMPMAEHNGWTLNFYTRGDDGALVKLASQPVTQQLNYKALNTVKLDTPVELPSGELYVAVAVTCNPDQQQVIGADPSVVTVGYSDLLRMTSEPDYYSTFDASAASGMSITCLAWAIDLGLEPDGYSVADNAIDHYNVYIDDTKAGETDALSFVVDDLADGTYSMGVEAAYKNGTLSSVSTVPVVVAAVYPKVEAVDVNAGENASTVIDAAWTAPTDRDLTSISYTTATRHANGIMGVSSNGYAIMAGAEYPAAMMRGLEGYRVESFRFYPLADAIFTFMLFEDDEMIYDLEVEDFTIGQWNDIALPDDVRIRANATYRLVLDCFDPEPEVKLLAVDNTMPRSFVSDLYSIDNGDTWNSLNIEAGVNGNWMIGFTVADEQRALPITGYDVYVDMRKVNADIVTGTNFTYDLGTWNDRNHTLRVDTYYTARQEAVRGTATAFHLSPAGISDAMIADITIQRGDNYLVVDGDGITALKLYGADGKQVAATAGSRIDISGLASGIYVVQIQAGDKVMSRKINVNR